MRFVILIAFFSYIIFFSSDSIARDKKPREDVRILIDVSGSMKQSDPNNLRVPALNLLLNMLPTESKAGVWIFAKDVNAIIPLGDVDERWKQRGLASSKKVHSKGLFTHIGLALETATRDWQGTNTSSAKSVILLTDGKVDISKDASVNEVERQRVLTQVLPNIKRTGTKVHTIALSDEVDKALLKEIATETDGFFATARKAEDLLKIFLQAFDQSIEQEQVPLTDNRFEIDSSIEEFTALIFRLADSAPSRIRAPMGEEYTKDKLHGKATWYSEGTFDLVTIKNPEPGTWRLIADVDPDNRVTVMSDLRISLEGLPNNIIAGDKLALAFYMEQEGKLIDKIEFLSLLDITFKQLYLDTGKIWEGRISSHSTGVVRVPKDGRFNAKLGKTLLPGVHEFSVEVDGKTFVRKKSKRLTVHPEAVKVVTVERETEKGLEYFLNIVPTRGLVKPDGLIIEAILNSRNTGDLSSLEVVKTEFGSWKVNIPPKDGDGYYEVLLTVNGTSTQGKSFSVEQGPYGVTYGDGSTATADNPPKVEPQQPENTEPDAEEERSMEPQPKPQIEEVSAEDTEESSAMSEAGGLGSTGDESEIESEGTEEEGLSVYIWIAIAVAANLIIGGVGYIVYKKIMNRREQQELAADNELIAALQAAGSQLDDDEDLGEAEIALGPESDPDESGSTSEQKSEDSSDQGDEPSVQDSTSNQTQGGGANGEAAAEEDEGLGDMLNELDDVFGSDDNDQKNAS